MRLNSSFLQNALLPTLFIAVAVVGCTNSTSESSPTPTVSDMTATPNVTAQPLPEGRIAFTVKGPNIDIYVMNPDGNDKMRLTEDDGIDSWPVWSPDGMRIAFNSQRTGDGHSRLYIMNPDGSDQTPLFPDSTYEDFQATWSPDGKRIAFVSRRSGDMEIWVANADGSDPVQLTDSIGFDWQPRWSPDGKKIAFSTQRDNNWEVYSMNADGSDPTRLTESEGYDAEPAWSPDSTRIAFVSTRNTHRAVWIMNADGSDPTIMIPGMEEDTLQPAWSPDGEWMTYTFASGTNGEVYITRIDGMAALKGFEPVNISRNFLDDTQSAWQP